MTGDGRADVVGADTDAFWVAPQSKDGTLGKGVLTSTTFGNPAKLVLADLDGDSVLEVLGGAFEGLIVHRSDATGKLTPSATHPGPRLYGLIAGDVDGDGHVDIVGIGDDGKGIHSLVATYRGDGKGGLSGVETTFVSGFPDELSQLALVDMDGDGKKELVALTQSSRLVVLPRDGVKGWGVPTLSAPLGTIRYSTFDVGDLDGDGRLDLALGDDTYETSGVDVLYRAVDGSFGAPKRVASNYFGSGPVRIVDINADGRNDVAVAHGPAFQVGVVLASGTKLLPEAIAKVPTAASLLDTIAIGDVDCDGCPDFVTTNVNGVVVFRGTGCGK